MFPRTDGRCDASNEEVPLLLSESRAIIEWQFPMGFCDRYLLALPIPELFGSN
jgi:hypothetical protein